jgi:hypothetical protein
MILVIRPRKDAGTRGSGTTRHVEANFTKAIRVMLAKALSPFGTVGENDGDSDSDDAYCTKKKPRAYKHISVDGALVDAIIAGKTVTIMQSRRSFILRLDAYGADFIKTVLQETVRQLSDTVVSETCPSSSTAFRFDDTTPNIRDKVVWDTNNDAWKLLCRCPNRFADENGRTLVVPVNLGKKAHAVAKLEAYNRALRAWNIFDKSKRCKILLLPSVCIDVQSNSSPAESQHDDSHGTVHCDSQGTAHGDSQGTSYCDSDGPPEKALPLTALCALDGHAS